MEWNKQEEKLGPVIEWRHLHHCHLHRHQAPRLGGRPRGGQRRQRRAVRRAGGRSLWHLRTRPVGRLPLQGQLDAARQLHSVPWLFKAKKTVQTVGKASKTLEKEIELKEKDTAKKMCNEDSIISMIIDTSWYLDMDSQFEECIESFQNNHKLPTLSYFAKNAGNGLDEKQTAAYEIICASFMLKAIEKYNLIENE